MSSALPHLYAERLAALFAGFDGAHGEFSPRSARGSEKVTGRAVTVPGEATRGHFERHLLGSQGLGIIPLRRDETAVFGAIDHDDRTCDHADLAGRVQSLGLPLVVCRSKSGGAHLYCFLRQPLSAARLRDALQSWVYQLGLPTHTEVFPKQVERRSEADLGNWINLPYFAGDRTTRHAVTDDGVLDLDQFLTLAEATRTGAESLPATAPVPEGRRNEQLFRHLCGLRARGANDIELQEAASTYNAARCRPPLDEREVAGIVRSVLRYEPGQDTEDVIDELNREFAQVVVGDKLMVLWEQPAGYRLLAQTSFRGLLAHKVAQNGDRPVPLADLWLKHARRRLYHGIVFEPGDRQTPNMYNLFRGWAVEARPGDCSLFIRHIREVLAGGNAEHAHWITSFLADLFQHPASKKGTALALLGPQGSGKTIVGHVLGKLLGQHYLLVSNDTLVTGRFNAHKQGLLLLHSDEAFFAGDHGAAGVLKDFITNDRQVIEKKGVDPYVIDNHARLLVTSEQDWVIPASLRERRFATFRLSDHRAQDHAYFGALMSQLEDHGGYEALLDYLQHYAFDPGILRVIPTTDALGEQKLRSLTPEQAWMLDLLSSGFLPGDGEGRGEAPSFRVYDAYVTHAGKRGARHKQTETIIGTFLRDTFDGRVSKRQVKLPNSEKKIVVRTFPPLAECRAMFEQSVGWRVPWDAPDAWVANGDEADDHEDPGIPF